MLVVGILFFAIGIFPILTGQGYGSAFIAVIGLLFLGLSYFSFVNAKQISDIEE